jgi:thiol-disulfide isomerase/thioredoxin
MIKILLIFLFMLPVASFGQNHFRLNVETPQSFNGSKVYLELKDNDIRFRRTIRTDFTTVTNGHFSFSGNLGQPCRKANLIFKLKKQSNIEFIVDSGTYDAKIDFNKANGSIAILIPHSISNRIKERLDSMQAHFFEDYKKRNNVSGAFALAPKDHNLFDDSHMDILKQYPHDYYSLLSLYNLTMYMSMLGRQEAILTTLNAFDEKLKKTSLALQILKDQTNAIRIRGLAKEGNTVPIFNVKTFDNKPFTNASLQGQPYIIAFSATWCIPCQEKLPELKALYKKYKDQGLKVIYFNEDDNMEVWRQHIIKDTLTWINVSERIKHSGIISSKLFDSHFLPNYLLINKNGITIYNAEKSDPDMAFLDRSLKSLFN